MRLDHPSQGQQVELVLLPVQVVVQIPYILLESGKAGLLNLHRKSQWTCL